jgi:hypothetical protein
VLGDEGVPRGFVTTEGPLGGSARVLIGR